ncbi:C2H2-type zinc finger protein [Halalkalicoccus jeotgali]|uniref:C2H2-type domain-containing protein n=1 Tax=Halalkalicoccus jeotgali (strain DSM 18796 / CECT 7217 / JCM 14584 / KCTC 4019 / B3) TaxID=795797 RepID=D8JA41_HALJB|nr:C2H2-type zinc finger protein [Halalkalicoccus jeotgali]ADJ14563.1 hypothetical protein HacjB3_05860 [Halalkalicoccus jeotgali B3]ELY39935.1 hypothetical protein C497_04232 [Halalkalicoccus jeotgali B3]
MVTDPREDEETEETDQFRCTICDETFDSQQELEQHGEAEHESEEDYSKQP